MVEYIKNSDMVIDFSYNHFMKQSKAYVERFYNMAVEYNKRKGLGL